MEPEDELLTSPLEEAPAEFEELDPAPSDDEDYDSSPLDAIDNTSDDLPYEPMAFDPSTIDDQMLMAELQRRQHLYQQPPPDYSQTYGSPDPRLAQIVELSYTNPQMAEALRLQIAEERAEARVMERIGPTLAPIAQREAIQNSGLSEHGQQYLSETFAQMPGVDVQALMQNPLTRDVLTRAARQFESERSARSAPRYESASSEAPTLSAEDWRAIRDFERMTGDRVEADVVRNARKGF